MISLSAIKIILLYLNNFPQNKPITTLFITADACSCEETLREARKRTKEKKKEDPREMAFTPDP